MKFQKKYCQHCNNILSLQRGKRGFYNYCSICKKSFNINAYLIYRNYKNGASINEICEEEKLNPKTVIRIIKEYYENYT